MLLRVRASRQPSFSLDWIESKNLKKTAPLFGFWPRSSIMADGRNPYSRLVLAAQRKYHCSVEY